MNAWLKRTWYLLVPIIISVLVIDWAAALMALHTLAIVALVLLFFDFLLDNRRNWGLFPTLNIDAALQKATSYAISSAFVWLGFVALMVTVLILVVGSIAHAAGIPERAHQYLPTLSRSINQHWAEAPYREVMPGQVEQESSWKETATLRTNRELGRGLTQLTITYNRDGSERYNAYRDAVAMAPLSTWHWRSDPYNVQNQLTYLVLRDRNAFAQTRLMMINDAEAWKAALVAYNAGMGRVLSRRVNAGVMGLSRSIWTGGLEHAHGQKENAILYGRPLWQAVNEYPLLILRKASKYRGSV